MPKIELDAFTKIRGWEIENKTKSLVKIKKLGVHAPGHPEPIECCEFKAKTRSEF